MGLLDDAIREHLELKRRRGADPGEVAREQREALDPVPRDEHLAVDDDGIAEEEPLLADAPVEGLAGTPDGGAHAEDDLVEAEQPAGGVDPANIGETAEIDMRSVLGEEGDAVEGTSGGHRGSGPAQSASGGLLPEEDSLEWEIPREASGEAPTQEVPYDDADEEQGSAEDVLEETPDFLRDTPEQERLWFEQRPPRDFDFDK
jgi:hypothetical protein